MGLYNNGYRLGNTPFRSGLGALSSIYNGRGTLFRGAEPTGAMRAASFLFGQYAGLPLGNLPPLCWMLPQKAGSMSMRSVSSGGLSANLIPSYPMSIDLTGSGDMEATAGLVVSMLIAMSGSGDMTATIEGRLNMSCDLTGSGDMTADLSGIASMAVDLLGEGSLEATIAAYGNMEIDIVVTGTGLSTANVGQAVWAQLLDAGYSAEELMRLFASVLVGKVSGAGTGTETFRDLADTKDRVVATVTSAGNRTNVTKDAT